MAEPDDLDPATLSGAHTLSPDAIERRAFSRVRKGLAEKEVRSFLRQLADEVAAAEERERALRARLAEVEEKLRHPPLPSRQQLVEALGEETTRVLSSAEAAAEDVRAKAQERADGLVRAAQQEASRFRDQQLADAARDAQSVIEAARERGREMVAEARVLRERVVADLNRRRSGLHAQLEQLRADRDRLVDAYLIVKQTVAQAGDALTRFEAANPFEPVETDLRPMPTLGPESPEPPELAPRAPAAEPEASATAPAGDDEGAHEVEVEGAGHGEEPVADDAGKPETRAERPEPKADASVDETGAAPRSSGVGGYVRTALGLGELPPEIAARQEPVRAEPGAPEPQSTREGGGGAVAAQPSEAPRPGASPTVAPSVDELFARVRAGREQAVAKARTVLTDAPEAADSTGADEERITEEIMVIPPAAPPDQEGRARDAELLARRDEVLTPLQHDLVRRAKRAVQDEQNALLDALRRRPRHAKPDAALQTVAEQVTTWADVLAPAVDAAYAAGRHLAGDERAEKAPARIVHALAEVLVIPLRDRLVTALNVTDGAENENDVIATRIGARYREWRGQELDARLGDLLAAAYARGVYDAAPEGELLRWVPAEEGRCPDADDNALEPTVRGECFPTGQQFPPAHPGCRCLLVVIDR